MPIQVKNFNDIHDLKTIEQLTRLYPEPTVRVIYSIFSGASHQKVFVARDGATLLGAAIVGSLESIIPLGLDTTPIAYVLSDVMVDPEYRKRGVASALCASVISAVRLNQGRLLYLHTSENNLPANSLYAKLGFTRLDKTRQGQTSWYMEVKAV